MKEKIMKAKVFNYTIVEVLPITELERFKDHHRLQTFYYKGCKCVNCGLEATILAKGEGRGSFHWDVYTVDFYPLTVDHIKPKSKGGLDELDNYQPMCAGCNSRKGNGEKQNGVQQHQFCKWPRTEYYKTAKKNKDNKEYFHLFKPIIQKLINSIHQ